MRDKIHPSLTDWLLILIVAVAVYVSTALPGYLLLKGLPWSWALAPDDNHIGTFPEKLGKTLFIYLPEPILGLDAELLV